MNNGPTQGAWCNQHGRGIRVPVVRRTVLAVLLVTCIAAAGIVPGCGSRAEPVISGISPSSGAPLTSVLISGSGFGEESAGSVVELAGVVIDHDSWMDTRISAKIPGDMIAGAHLLTVVVNGAQSNGIDFRVTGVEPEPARPSDTGSTGSSPKEVIIAYCDAFEMWHPDPQVKQGQKDGIVLVEKSTADPEWELWCRPIGEGDDIYFFLLHRSDGEWKVEECALRSDLWTEKTPQDFGAPSDISIPPEPWWP